MAVLVVALETLETLAVVVEQAFLVKDFAEEILLAMALVEVEALAL
jgi:hypothetical protein